MPYCPKCGGEYREGFRECSDCLLELVDMPPKNPRPPGLDGEADKPAAKAPGKKPSAIDNTVSCASCRPEVKLALVFRARNDAEAIEVKSMLSGSNISAVIAESGGEHGEVPVFVDENDAADARALIRTSYGKAVDADEEETVIYELEEGEDLQLEEDEEDEDEEDDDDITEGQYASTVEEKSEELRRRMEGTDSNRGLLIVLMIAAVIVLILLYLKYG